MQVIVTEGDITAQQVGVIVNAANSSLMGGGGVDGAIHRAAGPQLLQQCKQVRKADWPDGLPAGEVAVTGGAELNADYVIHTVGPNRKAGQTDVSLLRSCFTRSLEAAAELGVKTIAFPAIGAGVYGWGPTEVAEAAHHSVHENRALAESFTEIRFVLFDSEITEVFRQQFR